MRKQRPAVFMIAALMIISLVLSVSTTVAHPPWDPFDDTIFAPITKVETAIKVEPVATGLTAPLVGVAAPGQPDRLFVIDQVGILWAIKLGKDEKVVCPGPDCTIFLDVSARLVLLGVLGENTFDERGLLGVAFHPDYATNGLLYTYTSEPLGKKKNRVSPTFPTTMPEGMKPDHQSVVAEWKVPNPGDSHAVVDPRSRREILRVDQPQFNHDGGVMAFGPDGMLYIAFGDGGASDDLDTELGGNQVLGEDVFGHGKGNAQDLSNVLGAILRINPTGSDAPNGQYGIPSDNPFADKSGCGDGGICKEIFAYGFRNPFSMVFDMKTGNLYVGDVGQNDIEEVDLVVSGGNYGWNLKEGTLFFDALKPGSGAATPDDPGGLPSDLIDPIAQYDTHGEGHSVIVGGLYRGEKIEEIKGRFVFGDFSALFKFPTGPHDYGRLFHIAGDTAANDKDLREISEFRIVGGNTLGLALLGFGQDASGELYPLGNISGLPFGLDGVVLRISPAN